MPSMSACGSKKRASARRAVKLKATVNDTAKAFGPGTLDALVPLLARERVGHDWWTVDLCFWPDAWEATATCKTALDGLVAKYGS